MSKPKPKVQTAPVANKQAETIVKPEPVKGGFAIPYPALLLMAISFILYIPSLGFGFTELDDSIFIREFHQYNEDITNLITSFQRGLFNATQDPYYRPIFMDAMVLNYQISGIEIGSYHVINVLLHALTVFLLFQLLLKMNFKVIESFVLCLIFAAHPVLTQAVAWIPGRNDTLLAIFILAFIIQCINYANKGATKNLAFSILFLLLAFFTKETAIFAAPSAFVVLVFVLNLPLKDKRNITLYASWLGCFFVWFVARSLATIHISTTLTAGQQISELVQRLPLIIQYLGKIFIPVNLSVFPILEDTVIYFGIVALLGLGALLYFSKEVNWRIAGAGLAIFLLFLLPALMVPSNLNGQTFEHRLYLPMIGMLLILHETALFKRLGEKQVLFAGLAICAVLAILTEVHQKNFSDPKTFWRQAVKTSPHSAFANMMLGAREDSLPVSYELFRKAYALNPKEKYLNYYYGKMMQMQDSILASEKYLLAEKNGSGYYECDFYLARVAITKNDTLGSINYLKTYLKADPANAAANNNLLLMLVTRGAWADAKEQVGKMRLAGMPIPGELLNQINAHP